VKSFSLKSIQCETCTARDKSIFCSLSSEHLKRLDQNKTINQYKPKQSLFYESNQPHGLYCVNQGKIKIYKMDSEGHQKIVRLAGPGDILGYRSLILGEPYSATAETLENAVICFIDKKEFFHVLDTHPETASNVMKLLAKDLGHAENQEISLVHKSVRERLAELLLILKLRYGIQDQDHHYKIDIALSRQELADLIGTTQETLIRLISEFKEKKYISTKGKEIVINDLESLMEIAGVED
jgi:CRP-like cAMP-binding protein